MTERYINGVRIDQETWNKVKSVQEEMEKRPRRRPHFPSKKGGDKWQNELTS